jgi:hypothetical protein
MRHRLGEDLRGDGLGVEEGVVLAGRHMRPPGESGRVRPAVRPLRMMAA